MLWVLRRGIVTVRDDGSAGASEIGVGEVVALKEERPSGGGRKGVGETVAKVQSGTMPAALSKVTVRLARRRCLLRRNCNNLRTSEPHQFVKPPRRCGISTLDRGDLIAAALARVDATIAKT